MRESFLPFSRPSFEEGDVTAVAEVMRSGWLTTGPKVAEFESRFARFVGCEEALALSSATAGMHLLLAALEIGPGDEVITPSLTWVSTANLIVLVGATPVFADVDRHTLMVTADSIEAKLSPRTKLIIPVHYAGSAVDMAPIRALGRERGIPVVEDAAHAVGTTYHGEPIGKQGTAIFSFHAIKNLTTGEGGMFCSDDKALLEKVRMLRFHGLGMDAFDRLAQGRRPQAEVILPGFKYNLTDMAAALGLCQLARLERLNRRRRELAAYYRAQLTDVSRLQPLAEADYPVTDACHLMVVRLTGAAPDRTSFMTALKQRNIGTGIHFQAIHLQHYYRTQMGFHEGLLPATEWNSERIVSLPLFADMDESDIDDVIAAVREVLS